MNLPSLFQPGGWSRLKAREPNALWEAGLVTGGVLLIALTLRVYPAFDAAVHAPSSQPFLSASEADRQIDAAQTYLASHPDDFNTYVALAMAYYEKGPDHYVEGMNALEKARSLGATSEHLFFYAGAMYDNLGLPDYAINEFSKYLRHYPNDYETTIRLANLHFRQKHLDEAEALYKQALHLWPKDAIAWFNYAVINKEKGNYPLALSSLDEVIKIAGHLPVGGLYEKGEVYRLQGDTAKAAEYDQQELAKQPDYIPALEALEALARAKGDSKGAHNLRQHIADVKKQQQQAAQVQVQSQAQTPASVQPAPTVPVQPPPVPVKIHRRPTPAPAAAPEPLQAPASSAVSPVPAIPAAAAPAISTPQPQSPQIPSSPQPQQQQDMDNNHG